MTVDDAHGETAAGGLPRESLLDVVIETAPDAIITIDEAGRILSFSPAAERIFGWSEAEVAGRTLDVLMPEPHRSQHADYIARYLATGERRMIGIGGEVRAQRRSGEVFVAELAVGELRQDGRRIFTGFVRDVTPRVEAERRARRLQRRLERVARARMLGELSAALAHEINQPLAAITNFARALRRGLAADAPGEKLSAQADAIAEQALRAGAILERMRRMVDRGRAEVRPEDINEMIEEAVRVGHAGTGAAGPQVALELAPDLPPVLADRVQIQQVILNLVANAHEAMVGEGEEEPVHVASGLMGGEGQIRLRAGANEREVRVTVSDCGPGVPEGLAARIFDPLVTTKTHGLGVGLAVCRAIVEAHHGRIWAENRPEGGADVHFTLPVAGPA